MIQTITYDLIFTRFMEDINKVQKTLEKKAQKFGLQKPAFQYGEPYIHERKEVRTYEDAIDGLCSETIKVKEEVFDLTIQMEELKLSEDWALIAAQNHQTGSVTQLDITYIIPEELMSHDSHCDHCHRKQYRSKSYIILNTKTKEWMKVGSTCLKDFLGINPTTYINMFTEYRKAFDMFNEDGGWYAGSSNAVFVNIAYSSDECLYKAIEVIKEEKGFVKAEWKEEGTGRYDRDGDEYMTMVRANHPDATLDKVRAWLESTLSQVREEQISTHKVTTNKFRKWMEAREIRGSWEIQHYPLGYEMQKDESTGELKNIMKIEERTYFRALEGFDSWLWKAQNVSKEVNVRMDSLSTLIAAFGYYTNQLKIWAKAEALAAKTAKLGHYGNEKERVRDYKLTVVNVFTGESDWGAFYIITLQNKEGQQFVYKGSKSLCAEKGDEMLMTFTIKSHGDFRGVKQTNIARPLGENISRKKESKKEGMEYLNFTF